MANTDQHVGGGFGGQRVRDFKAEKEALAAKFAAPAEPEAEEEAQEEENAG